MLSDSRHDIVTGILQDVMPRILQIEVVRMG
jgi:hypothetical protein